MARYALLLYDDSVSYRSMTVPKGAELLVSDQDLATLSAKAAEMAGGPPTVADGGPERGETDG